MGAVFKRELKSYFLSPIGYIFVGFFLLLSGYFFAVINIFSEVADLKMVFSNISFIFLLLVPILTMRLLSEEKKTKTEQLLLTSPVNITSIVLGKFFAALCVLVIALAITAVYPIILFIYSKPALGEILGSYLGFFLMGGATISVGLFISSLTENQIISAIASFGILLLLWLVDWIAGFVQSPAVAGIIKWFSITSRYSDFALGQLALSPIVYYISFAVIFIFLTIRVIERRRWS